LAEYYEVMTTAYRCREGYVPCHERIAMAWLIYFEVQQALAYTLQAIDAPDVSQTSFVITNA
jgi:hypothetical protein